MLGGCRSSREPNCPRETRTVFGVADSPVLSGVQAASGLLLCQPRAACPAVLLPVQRGLKVSWLVSPQEPSEECARKSTTSLRMQITSKTRLSISSVSLLSHGAVELCVLPEDTLAPRCAGIPLPIPQHPELHPAGPPTAGRWPMGRSPPGSLCSSGDPPGYPSVAMSRCSSSVNGAFVWHSLSPWLVPAAAAQPELVGARGPLGTGTPRVPGAAPQGCRVHASLPVP